MKKQQKLTNQLSELLDEFESNGIDIGIFYAITIWPSFNEIKLQGSKRRIQSRVSKLIEIGFDKKDRHYTRGVVEIVLA